MSLSQFITTFEGAELTLGSSLQESRVSTPRECARFQGFPDGYKLEGSPRQVMRQIGNALEYHIARAHADQLLRTVGPEQG